MGITSKKKIVSSSLRIRKAEEFSTFYYYTKQQLKKERQLQRERKNIIKSKSKSDAHLRHYARISNIMSMRRKKVKNNYSRVRKRRPRKILLVSQKKLHISSLKYKNTNSMD